MSESIQLPLSAARQMLLAVQGLLQPPAQQASKESLLAAIRRMGVLQIDTIHVVARSPYLVLFSRLGDYNPDWLNDLLAEGALFEYWAHAACFVPIEDYPLLQHRMGVYDQHYYKPEWRARHAETIQQILAHIRENGPVRSADFERSDGQKGGWWNWKAEKMVLEFLHTNGALMIARRENFQRVYDLRERVLPGWDDSQALTAEEAQDVLAERTVRLLGAAPARWVSDYYRLPKQGISERLARLAEAGRLETMRVPGWKDVWYLHPENRSLAEWALAGELNATYTTLLSPFDPLVWHRERARALFDFDYSIECYLPESKRRYGYFSLPILHQGALVGRLDAKAHRKEGRFEVKALHLEPAVELSDDLAEEVGRAIQRCADWHRTPQVEIVKSEPGIFKDMLAAAQ